MPSRWGPLCPFLDLLREDTQLHITGEETRRLRPTLPHGLLELYRTEIFQNWRSLRHRDRPRPPGARVRATRLLSGRYGGPWAARNVGGACHVASQTPGRGRRTAALQDRLWARGPPHSCSPVPATGQHLVCPSRCQSDKALHLSEPKRSLPRVPPARDQGPPRTRYTGRLPIQIQQVWGEATGTTAPRDHTARPQLGTVAAVLCAGTVRTRVPS